VGRGSFSLGPAVGEWMAIAFRIKLNEPGCDNGCFIPTCMISAKFTFFFAGEIQLWIDGVSVINVCGLNLRMSNEGQIKGMHFSTFFGGEFPSGLSPCQF